MNTLHITDTDDSEINNDAEMLIHLGESTRIPTP